MAVIRRYSDIEVSTLTGDRGTSMRLINPASGSENLSVSLLTLKPNAPWGAYHYHERAETLTIILSGRARLVANGVHYELGPQTVVYVPPGEPHEMTSVGDEALVKIDIYSPPRGTDVVELPWDSVTDGVELTPSG